MSEDVENTVLQKSKRSVKNKLHAANVKSERTLQLLKNCIFDIFWDIQNNYFGYQKLCQKGVLFEISIITISDIENQSVSFLDIQNNDTLICDIKNSYYGYSK